VKKSSGKLPPILFLNIANISAKSLGFICLAASNLKPVIPIENKSVK